MTQLRKMPFKFAILMILVDNLYITECVAGSYGHNCTKKCGKCLDSKSCNVTTGTCENGCSAGYQGRLCDSGKFDNILVKRLGVLIQHLRTV